MGFGICASLASTRTATGEQQWQRRRCSLALPCSSPRLFPLSHCCLTDHTGIEFSGTEYSFAGGPDAGSGTGVMSQQPRATPDGAQWRFKEAIELGSVNVDYREFERVLQELKDAFPANTYDLIHRNCNRQLRGVKLVAAAGRGDSVSLTRGAHFGGRSLTHSLRFCVSRPPVLGDPDFTTAVSKRLGVHGKYPSWVNRAASWGSVFTAPPKHLQPIAAPKPKESVFKSTVGHRMDGGATIVPKGVKVAAPVAAAATKPAAKGEHKKADTPEAKSGGAASGRRNPWADPNFVPVRISSTGTQGRKCPPARAHTHSSNRQTRGRSTRRSAT